MKINVVTVNSGWILQKIAERIVLEGQKLGHEFILSHNSMNNVDCNFYVDIQNCYHGKTNSLDIGLFTHMDGDNINTVNRNCLSLNHIIHMCTRYYTKFKTIYPENKMSVLYPSEVNSRFTNYKPQIGIFQRGKYEGKGYYFMLNLIKNPIIKNFKFKFIGKDWEGVVKELQTMGVEVDYHTSEDYNEYENHYHDVDYVLIPSLWEGGPMSLIEGLACGKPIISSNVGMVGDFDVDYVYEPNDIDGLIGILNSIYDPIKKRRDSVECITYENYVKNLVLIIESLKK